MALRPEDLIPDPLFHPLSTGFNYRPAEEVPDFQIRPPFLAGIDARLKELEIYRQRPPLPSREQSQPRKPQHWEAFFVTLEDKLASELTEQTLPAQPADSLSLGEIG